MTHVFERPFDQPPELDELVQETMRWHFSPETGSPFWLRYKQGLRFDPLRDVKTFQDLRLFPDVSQQWKEIAAEELLPQGCRSQQWAFQVFESGGTTDAPKRIIEMSSRRRGVEWVNRVLSQHDVPTEGHWLHIGPSGPHAVGRSVGLLAQMRRSLCYYIDFDPRWVKRCIRMEWDQSVRQYIDHVIEQTVTILETQPIAFIFATPPILEEVCNRPKVLSLFQKRARVLIWSGTSASEETLRLLEEEFFPEAKVIGLYGNTMMGIACQRPRLSNDTERCVFQTFYPYCQVEVVKLDNAEEAADYGETGQVKVTLLSREIFLPNNMERDCAVRQKPVTTFPWDGLARIGVLRVGKERVIEGVY